MRYKSNANFVIRDVAGESVVVPLVGSTAKMGNMFAINETGSVVIKAMQEGLDFEEIVARILGAYDVPDQAQLRADLSSFIGQLVSKGFFQEEA